MLAQCPQFESGSTEFAEAGTDRHSALREYYEGKTGEYDMLDEEQQEGIKWAADYIRAHVTGGAPMEWEVKRTFTAPNFQDISGTPDLVNGADIFDLKWRYRDYSSQMACYALMALAARLEVAHGCDSHTCTVATTANRVRVHLLFGAIGKAEVLTFDVASAEALIAPILDNLNGPATPCDYCGWCAKRLMCPALTGPAKHIAQAYADLSMVNVASWHPSEMENPEHLALALTIWRHVLKKWGESVEFHASEAVTKGQQLPGYELKERQGKKFVSDTKLAYELSGIPPEKFLQACTVRINSSKKYPEQVALDQLFKEQAGSLAAAKRMAEKKLADVIKRGRSTMALVASKGDEQEEAE